MATSVTFVDSRVPNLASTLSGLGDCDWYILSPDEDGVAEMRRLLAGYSDLEAIHVVSHGSAGALLLGSSRLDAAGLASHAEALADVGSALAPTGDLVLYGCDVAHGDAGLAFVEELAQLTSRAVAASSNATGAAALGGDWHLEAASGPIEAITLTGEGVGGLLAIAAAVSIAAVSTWKPEGLKGSVPFTFVVTRSGDTSTTESVDWAVTGAGPNPATVADFAGGLLPSGTVTFAPGETSQIITVTVQGDVAAEPEEGFTVDLSNETAGLAILSATAAATIIDEVGARFVVAIDAVATQSNSSSLRSIFSPDGTTVAFQSFATNLVPGDTNDRPDHFVKNLATGVVVRVSTDAAGGQAEGEANNFSDTLGFSADSTKVVFVSLASNLVPGDTNARQDIFIKDLTTGATTRVSTDAAGTQANDKSSQPMFSSDGTKVVFSSLATNLVPGDTNATRDIFVKDLTTGAITLVSADAAGAQANAQSDQPIFSPDGTKVVFTSLATNLVPGDTNGTRDIFIKDLATGATQRVSTNAAGVQSNGQSNQPIFSPDGTKLAFISSATNLVTGDSNGTVIDLFIKDLVTGTIVLVSTNAASVQANDASSEPAFSPDGTRLSFESEASNLVTGDTNGTFDVFVKDLTTGAIQRVSTDAAGVEGDSLSLESNFSPDGARLIISSDAANLVTGDTNDLIDVFIAALNLVSVTATDAVRPEGSAGTTLFSFTVSRTGVVTQPLSVDWSVAGTDAHPADGADLGGALPFGTVSFAAGESSKIVTVTVAGDSVIELDETFGISLSNVSATDFMLGTKTASGVIQNDDAPVASIAADTAALVEEAGHATVFTFTVSLDRAGPFAETVDWTVSGSGASPADGADFGGLMPTGTLTFDVGETSKTIAIGVVGDTDVEPNEVFQVALSNPSSGLAIGIGAASATILNDDSVSVSIAALSAAKAEQDSGTIPFTFTVTLSEAAVSALTVDWTATGTGDHAADGADFVGGVLPSGTVTFAAGETSKTIILPVSGDTAVEFDDFFVVTLSNPSPGLALGTASAFGVAQNDDRAKISIAPLAASKAEGDSGTTAFSFAVSLDQASFADQVADWMVTGSGGNATNAADFGGAFPSGKVSFAAGETSKVVTVLVTGDTVAEFNEDFAVTLSNLTFGLQLAAPSATGTILNDDKSVVSVTAGPGSKAEGTGGATTEFDWTVSLDRAGVTSQTVAWAVTGGGAHPADAADLAGGALPSGTLTFAPGEISKTVTIDVAGDATVEFDEGVVLTLSTPSSGLDLGTPTMVGTILNDDLSVVSIAAQSASKAEGNSGTAAFTFTVGLSQAGVTSQAVGWSVVGTGASATDAMDFGGALPAGTVTFAAGETSKVVTIQVSGDTVAESHEAFLVTLSSPSSGLEFGTASAGGTILDDDASVSIAASSAVKAEGTGGTTAFTFAVTMTGDASATRTVGWGVTGSGASKADGADFAGSTLPTGTLTFTAGETSKVLTINVNADTTVELDEGFVVTLSNPPPGWKLGTRSASGTIQNDDNIPVTVTAHDDAYVVLEGQSLSIAPSAGVLLNDQSASSASLLAGTTQGTLQLNGNGGFGYTPVAGFTGVDSFTYHAVPGGNGVDGKASLYVVPVNVGASTTLDLLGLNAEEQIAATYAAFFGRAADAGGFRFWVGEFNRGLPVQGPGALFANIASSFGISAEAKALYPFLVDPFGASDAQISIFLDSVYNNLFNRSSDAGGLAYWTGQIKATLQAGQFVGSVLVNIMSGAQDTVDGKDITTLMGKVAVSLEFVREQEEHHTVWAGASDVAAATGLLHGVASDAASVLIGVKNAETLIANHA